MQNFSTEASKMSDPLHQLLAMPISERIEVVNKDMQMHTDKFKEIYPHDLAEALEVPEADCPNPCEGWLFTRYARKESVETYAESTSPAYEIVYLIEDKVSPERFRTLMNNFQMLEDIENPKFDFLTEQERELLVESIASKELEGNASDGMNCIAHYIIKTASGDALWFEAVVEDDGACINLRTPYEYRDNMFVNLENCLIDEW